MSIGASIGIALRRDDEDWSSLAERADLMLYQAKQAGRGRYFAGAIQ
jgi:PleD family two-component response regulator